MSQGNCAIGNCKQSKAGSAGAPGGGAAKEHPDVAVVPDAALRQVLVQRASRDAADQETNEGHSMETQRESAVI